MATRSQGTDFEFTDRMLKRNLGLSQLLLLSLGAIVGSGWLFAVLSANTGAGGGAFISWIVGGILVLLIALTYAEVSTMLPRSGAVVRYPHLTHGGFTGFVLGWAYLLASCSVPAIEAIATVQYLAPHVPASWHILQNHASSTSLITFPQGFAFVVILLIAFFFVNYFGARFLGRFNNTVMVWKLALPTLTFLFLFFLDFHPGNYTAGGGLAPFGTSAIFTIIPGAGIVFSYLGFRQGLEFGGEARNPQRDIPIATILSVLIGTLLYTLLQLAFTGGINWGILHIKVGDWTALGALPVAASSPFYAILKASGVGFLGGFAALLLADAVVSPFGTGYIYLGTGGRTIYGLGIDGYFPKASKAIHPRTRVPWVALLASFIVAVAFSFPSKSWYGLVGFITSATVFTYIMGGVGLSVLRRTAPDLPRPYRLGAHQFFAPVGFLAAILIIFWSGFVTDVQLVAALFVALPLFAWIYMVQKGYTKPAVAYPLGVVFLAAWLVLQWWGHWILSPRAATVIKLHAPFAEWLILCMVAVFGFTFLLWLGSTREGRHEINRTWWLLVMTYGLLTLTWYSGSLGVLVSVPRFLTFGWATLWAAAFGLVIYFWAVAAGYRTPEIEAINATGTGMVPAESETAMLAGTGAAVPGQ